MPPPAGGRIPPPIIIIGPRCGPLISLPSGPPKLKPQRICSSRVSASVMARRSIWVISVSYTHLDVYKRQIQLEEFGHLAPDFGLAAAFGHAAIERLGGVAGRLVDQTLSVAALGCLLYTSRCV